MAKLFSRSINQEDSVGRCFCYFLIDLFLLLCIGLLSYALFIGVIPPFKRGFYCDDESIRLPFKPNTVTVPVLLSLCIVVPFMVVEMYEYLIIREYSNSYSSPKYAPKHHAANNNYQQTLSLTKHFLTVTTAINVEFMLGHIVVIALTHFGKSAFGRLRPHFVDICKPNFSLIDCTKNFGYVIDPMCTSGALAKELKVARESFPSGHSSTVTFALCFLIFYIYCKRVKLRRSYDVVVKYCYVFSLALLGIFACFAVVVFITRVTDNWHHKSDVVGGIVIGVIVSCVLFLRTDSALMRVYDNLY